MRPDVESAMKASSRTFLRVVWPHIAPWLGGGSIIPVETVDNPLFRALDATAGVDAWQYKDGNGLRAIASRVQKAWEDRPPFNTFTIRYQVASGGRTEYDKLVSAAESTEGWVSPHYHVQAYTGTGAEPALRSVGVIQTWHLVQMATWVAAHPVEYSVKTGYGIQRNKQDGNRFICMGWDWLQERGCDITFDACVDLDTLIA